MMLDHTPGLVVDIRCGEVLNIANGEISIELVKKSGQAARLRVVAPIGVAIKKELPCGETTDVASMA